MKLVLLLIAAVCALEQGVRKDWKSMSQTERDHFTRAVNLLKQNGGFDDLVAMHRAAYRTPAPWRNEVPNYLYRNGDQKGPAFLPWHRVQLNMYEQALQKAINDPTLRVPYWNYMEDSALEHPTRALVWSADHGIGGTGREDGVVVDGPFAYWPIKHADMGEKYLSRNLGGVFSRPSLRQDFNAAFEQSVYDVEPWSSESKVGFRNWLEGFYSTRGPAQGGDGEGVGTHITIHAMAHAFIGRSMINSTSPNDPAFYMLHAFTDAMWYSWQVKQMELHPGSTPLDHFVPKSGGPIGHNLDDKMFELNGATTRDVIDYRTLDYTYDVLPRP